MGNNPIENTDVLGDTVFVFGKYIPGGGPELSAATHTFIVYKKGEEIKH